MLLLELSDFPRPCRVIHKTLKLKKGARLKHNIVKVCLMHSYAYHPPRTPQQLFLYLSDNPLLLSLISLLKAHNSL